MYVLTLSPVFGQKCYSCLMLFIACVIVHFNFHFAQLSLSNALRYFPPHLHEVLAAEFAKELRDYGHIYMYRFRPVIEMKAYPIHEYPAKCRQAAGMMHMIMNNLDARVAQVSLCRQVLYV